MEKITTHTNIRHRTRITLFALAIVCVSLLIPSAAQAVKKEPFSTAGKLRIEGSGVFGRGFKYEVVGYTVGTNEPVRLSGGGGGGANLTLGYGLTKHLDMDFTAGHQKSKNRENVVNGDIEFKRSYLLGTFKLKLPLKTEIGQFNAHFKIGAGVGYYTGVEMNLTHYDLYTGAETNMYFGYKDAIGYHMTAEFETITPKLWSFSIGLRAYSVKYESDTYTLNGPNAIYFVGLIDKFKEVDGSGIDLTVGIGKYF